MLICAMSGAQILVSPGNPTGLTESELSQIRAQKSSLALNAMNSPVTMSLTTPQLSIDSLALVDLYDSTNGSQWTNKTNWKIGRLSTWFGVTISNGRVTKVNLGTNNLGGKIPKSIGNLQKLSELYLSSNHISGGIPSTIGNLTLLTILYLQYNSLSGPIPATIGSLTRLQLFYAWDNHLSGDIPATMGNLTSLRQIGIHNNNLTGDLNWIGSLTAMQQLFYYSNPNLNCTLPNSIGNLTNLTVLAGGAWSTPLHFHSKVHGPIPASLGNCTRLTAVYLDNSEHTGQVPTTLSQLRSLKVLSLWNNPGLEGNLNEVIAGIATLNQILIDNTAIGGTLPATAINANLNSLFLSDSKVTTIPPTLTSATNLVSLGLDSLDLAQIPNWALNFSKLTTLFVGNNKLSAIPNFSTHPNKANLTLRVFYNNLDFGDLEPLFTAPGTHPFAALAYTPQADIGLPQNLYFQEGKADTLKVTTAGTSNTYHWQKLDNTSAWQDLSGATASQLIFPNVVASDSGFYRLKITNQKVTGLTLYSSPFHVKTIGSTLPPIVQDVTICAGQTATLAAEGAGSINWYDVSQNGTSIFSGNSYVTPIVSSTTVFFVSQTINGVESVRRPVTVTVDSTCPTPEGLKVYFHTGNSFRGPSPWNNALSQPNAGAAFGDLKDNAGNNTGIKIELLTGWGGAYPSDVTTGNNTGAVPDSVLMEYYWFGLGITANEMRVKVSGLMPTASYNFSFMGASAYHGSGITDNGNTIYAIGSASASLPVENNKIALASIRNITPNAQGEVEVVITKASNAAAGYLNAIIIELPADVLYTPSGTSSSLSAGALSFAWNDNNTTETGYEVYRANVIDGGDFQLLGSTAANTSTFVDNNVLEGYTYQYKVRAKNATRISSFSAPYQVTVPVTHGLSITTGSHIFFDFGKSNSGPAPWNNAAREPAQGTVFSNLKDQDGVSTGINIELLTAWGGAYTDGATTGNNSGIVPDDILKDYYWFGLFGAPEIVRFRITGLTAGSSYNIRLIGSSVFRQAGVTDNGHTIYKIGTDEVSLDVEGNTNQSADFNSIKANSNGEIVVTITKDSDAMVGYINAMIIDLPTEAMYTPAALKGVYAEATGVSLFWQDNNAAETGNEIYRSNLTANSPYVLVATTTANAVSYTDNAVSQNTVYKYKIRAINGTGASSYSQEATVRTMPIKKVLFNFGKTLEGPAPWNNAKADPQIGTVFSDLKDEFGVTTGLTLQLLTDWGGVSNDGAVTGNDSGIVPDNVLKEYYWFAFLGSPNEVQFKISGLSPGKLYNFRIVGSSVFRYGNLTDNGNNIYTIGNTSVSLNVESNTSASADFFDVAPDANGEVIVKATKANNAFAGYINALMIDLPKDMLYVPSALSAKYTGGTGVMLNWGDNNATETGYEVYRSTTSGSEYALVSTTAANAVSYTDGSAQEGTLYYYKIRAVNASTTSGYSAETMVRAVEYKKLSFKFGVEFPTPPKWNTAGAAPVVGARYAHLADEFGFDAGVSVKLLTAWGGVYSGGPTTGNNSGVVPDDVLKEYYWFGMFGAPEEVTFLVSGLHPQKTYNFKFLGSAIYHASGTDNGNTTYMIGDRSISLAVENNTSKFAELNEVQPNASGEVQVTIKKGAGAMAGFINALVLEMPKNLLYAPPVIARYTQGAGVALTWPDNNSMEAGYQIYRSTDDESAYTLLTTTAASATSFTDMGVVHGGTYYYKIRAVNGTNVSVYGAPTIVDCINKQVVRLKFGKNLAVAAPWNNTAADPVNGASFNDLLDDTGNNSGVSVQLEGDWGGVYNQGTTTGNDSGVVPDAVLGEYYYFGFLSTTTEVKFKVKGLIPSTRYNFKLVGSSAFRGGGVTDNGYTVYGIGEESVSLYVEGNTSNYAEILNAVADANGEIEVRISKGQGAAVGYINGMMLEVPAGGPNYWAIADGNWSGTIWNTNKSATVGQPLPVGSTVRIEGRTVTVNTAATAKEITVSSSATAPGKLIIDNAELINSGALEVSTDGDNELKVVNDGRLTVTGSPIKIMPIGNSITQGNFNYPGMVDHKSYRYELWKKLIDEGVNFDYIGSQTTNYNGNPVFPDYKGKTFDTDNEGHFGYRADELAAGLPAWLSGRIPDIALVHAGVNDMVQDQSIPSTINDIKAIIAILRTANPSVKICLAQIVPSGNAARNVNVASLNAAIKQDIYSNTVINTKASPIILVDQFTDFDLANIEPDEIHVKEAGELFMAGQWYKGLMRAFQSDPSLAGPERASTPCGDNNYSTAPITLKYTKLGKGCDNTYASSSQVILGKGFSIEKGSRAVIRADYTKTVLTNSDIERNYNGLISSVRWRTETPFGLPKNDFNGGYVYTYDERSQVVDATWADQDLTSRQLVAKSDKFRTTNLDYDPNGNIKTLKRYNALRLPQHDFTYHYGDILKNRLTAVENYTSAYEYDASGRMVTENKEDGDGQSVDYDVTGKVIFVYTDEAKTNKKVQYQYDDRGFRLAKIVYPITSGENARTTWYIRDAEGHILSTYEQEGEPVVLEDGAVIAVQTEIPIYGAGKLGTYYPQQEGGLDYELTDHLGNVRALVRDNIATFTCTMEDNPEATLDNPRDQELRYFQNLVSSEQKNLAPWLNHTAQSAVMPNPNYAAYLNGNEGRIVGPAISLRVQAGDQLHINTFVKYRDAGSYTNVSPLVGIIGAMASTYAGTVPLESIGQATEMFTNGFAAIGPYGGTDFTRPRAFLAYILFDEELNYIDSKFIRASDDAAFETNQPFAVPFEELLDDVAVTANGYIYIYVTNETPGVDVWFDDLGVVLKQNIVKQATDYGLWGDVIREQKADESVYRFGYQGQFAEKDSETGWNHFELREYDPVVGRWTATDPYGQFWSPYLGMGNNPVSQVDPDGGYCPKCPGGAEYDSYRGSNLNYSYDAIVGGDGVFQLLEEVSTTQSSWDNFVDGLWWISPIESVDIYAGAALKMELVKGPVKRFTGKTVTPYGGQVVFNTNTGWDLGLVGPEQSYVSGQVGLLDVRGAPLVGIGGDYDPSIRLLYNFYDGTVPDAPILKLKVQGDLGISGSPTLGARAVVQPAWTFPIPTKKTGFTGELNAGARLRLKIPEIIKLFMGTSQYMKGSE
jgi:RHS repeat-associated protein